MTDLVNHPAHYTSNASGVETIELTEPLSFCTGNAVKYLARYKHKGKPLEDVKKAEFYIKREIDRLVTLHRYDTKDYNAAVPTSYNTKLTKWCAAEDSRFAKSAIRMLCFSNWTNSIYLLKVALEDCQSLIKELESGEDFNG